MDESPPAYHSVYDNIPFEQHPDECPCIYHQVDGDALIKQAEEAEQKDWAYAYYNHHDQLTRESIIEYFGTRENWAMKHAIWLGLWKRYADAASQRINGAQRSQEWTRREIEHRRQFVGLVNNEAYDREWRAWDKYMRKVDALYQKGGAMQRFRVQLRVMEGMYKEAGELYEFFWDLEDHRGSVEIDEGCKAILEKLRANLKRIRSLQPQIIKSTLFTENVFFQHPPDWVGGLTAPTHPIQRPEDVDPLRCL